MKALPHTKDYYKDGSKTTLYPLKTKISKFAENKVFQILKTFLCMRNKKWTKVSMQSTVLKVTEIYIMVDYVYILRLFQHMTILIFFLSGYISLFTTISKLDCFPDSYFSSAFLTNNSL